MVVYIGWEKEKQIVPPLFAIYQVRVKFKPT